MALVLELLGRDSNLLLIDLQSDVIMECLHRIPEKEAGTRVVLPRRAYVPPPKREDTAQGALGSLQPFDSTARAYGPALMDNKGSR